MNKSTRLILLAAALSPFIFSGCATGGGGTMRQPDQSFGAAGSSACPDGTVFMNGQCVSNSGQRSH